MTRDKQVVITLGRIGIAHQSASTTNRFDLIEATGDQFVWIDLMTGVPDQPVPGKVEHLVQGNAQFNDSQVTMTVPLPSCSLIGPVSDNRQQRFSNFVGQLIQLSVIHVAQLSGRLNLSKEIK